MLVLRRFRIFYRNFSTRERTRWVKSKDGESYFVNLDEEEFHNQNMFKALFSRVMPRRVQRNIELPNRWDFRLRYSVWASIPVFYLLFLIEFNNYRFLNNKDYMEKLKETDKEKLLRIEREVQEKIGTPGEIKDVTLNESSSQSSDNVDELSERVKSMEEILQRYSHAIDALKEIQAESAHRVEHDEEVLEQVYQELREIRRDVDSLIPKSWFWQSVNSVKSFIVPSNPEAREPQQETEDVLQERNRQDQSESLKRGKNGSES